MFTDRDAITGGEFSSCWKMELSLSESECQTMPSTTAEMSCQVGDTAEADCQTEDGSQTRDSQLDETALAKFVTEAAHLIEDEMEAIACSSAWDGFDGYGLDDTDETEEVTLVKHLDVEEGWKVSDISWNAIGSTVVASLVQDHSDWCSHIPKLNMYRVDRKGDVLGDEPSQVFNTPSCVTVLQAHPLDSMVLAAGCHTGEVLIYRPDREGESEVMSSGSVESQTDTHNPVTALLWLAKNSLVSVHSTGFIRMYTVDARKSQLILKKTFLVAAMHLPKTLKPLRSSDVGLRHAAVSEDDPNNLILSTEAGMVIMTDLTHDIQVPSDLEETFYDPVVSVYPLHKGAITTMELSPYDDNILATAGEDLKLHLVAVMSPHTPALSYQLDSAVSSLSWSPTRPCLLAAATNRFVLLFDTVQLKTGPVMKIKHTERKVNLPLTVCIFPPKDGARLVSADKFGRIFFWKLPQHLNAATIQEKNIFQNLPYICE